MKKNRIIKSLLGLFLIFNFKEITMRKKNTIIKSLFGLFLIFNMLVINSCKGDDEPLINGAWDFYFPNVLEVAGSVEQGLLRGVLGDIVNDFGVLNFDVDDNNIKLKVSDKLFRALDFDVQVSDRDTLGGLNTFLERFGTNASALGVDEEGDADDVVEFLRRTYTFANVLRQDTRRIIDMDENFKTVIGAVLGELNLDRLTGTLEDNANNPEAIRDAVGEIEEALLTANFVQVVWRHQTDDIIDICLNVHVTQAEANANVVTIDDCVDALADVYGQFQDAVNGFIDNLCEGILGSVCEDFELSGFAETGANALKEAIARDIESITLIRQ